MSHTAAPWEVVKTFGNPPSFNIWADANDTGHDDKTLASEIMNEADAHLMAAAPEMLEALRRVARDRFEPDKWMREVRIAIAKAKGETP